jgi:predicted metal-dependent peptidase
METRAERLLLARTRAADFTEKYPFHTAVLARMRVLADPTIDTMGVSMEGRELLLHVNEPWLEAHAEHTLGLLLHEVHHVVLGHLVDARLREVDAPELLDVCLECAANEHIVEPLPNPIRWQAFERLGFRPNQSSLERYALLREHVRAHESARRLPMPGPSDAHAGMRSPVARASLALQRDLLDELADLEERLGDDAGASLAGWRPGELRRALFPESGTAAVDWRAALRDLVERTSRTVSSYKRPSRRFPDRVGEVPGRQRQRYACDPPRLVVALDTSASMGDADLACAAAELARIARIARVTVVVFDAAIHAVYRYRGGPLDPATGGGGTDFRALFGPASPTRGAEALVVFTDGLGPFPDRAPAIPTLWVLTGASPAEPPFGRRARLGVKARN